MHSRIFLFLAAFAGAVVLIGIGLFTGTKESAHSLEIEPKSLELGEVWPQQDHQHQLTIRNVSSRQRTISEFDASCPCARIEPASFTLGPGTSRQITMHINLLTMIDKADQENWPASVRFRAHVKDEPTCPSWRVSGNIRSPVAKLPFFGTEAICLHRNEPPRTLTYAIHASHGAVFDELISNSRFVKCGISSNRDGALFGTMEIDPSQMDEGPFMAKAELMFKDLANNKLPPIPWEVRMWIKPSVEFDPPVALMGQQRRQLIDLRSTCKGGFKIVSISQAEGLSVRVHSPSSGDSLGGQQIELEATPIAHSDSLIPLRFVVRHESSQLEEPLTLMVQRPTILLATGDSVKP